jgi:hypothetical protein
MSLGSGGPKPVDAKKFLKSLGYFMPPEEELLLLKKAIVGNDLDVAKIFNRYSDETTPEQFNNEFGRGNFDLVPELLTGEDLDEIHEFLDAMTDKNGTVKKADLDKFLDQYTPDNTQIM